MTDEESSIKNIKDVFYDTLDDWPTESLKKSLFRLRPEEGAEVYLNLNEGYHDITDKALELESEFRPKVTIRTSELKTELDKWKTGGGAFFRAIADAENVNDATRLCLQYFIIWTRQLFPFQFVFLAFPFFIATLFLWQFSETQLVGSETTWGTYLTLMVTGLLFIGMGFWTYIEGFYRQYIQGIKNWKVVPDSMIGFVVPGILFWTTALEYLINDVVGYASFIAIIPISAWLSLAIGIVILIIGLDFYLRGEKSYMENFSHPMDYAPLFLYLQKDSKGNWDIDGAQFDFFHYRTVFVLKEKLTFSEEAAEKTNPWFLIDRSWHAFREYTKTNLMLRIFANLFVNIFLWIIAVGAYIVYILARFGYNLGFVNTILEEPWFLIIIYVILPIFMVLMLWSIGRTREYKLDLWEDLANKEGEDLIRKHHLSYPRLRVLWNLRNREHKGEQRITSLWAKTEWIEGDKSRLVARVKLQFPFDRYKDWHTLRDTQEELLSLISLQTKEEELRDLQEEITKVRSTLQQQMVVGIKQIEEELDEFFEEKKEEIEEEEIIKEELDVVEETVVDEDEVTEEIIDEISEIEAEVTESEEEFEIPDIPLDIVKEEDETPQKTEEDFDIPDIPIETLEEYEKEEKSEDN